MQTDIDQPEGTNLRKKNLFKWRGAKISVEILQLDYRKKEK